MRTTVVMGSTLLALVALAALWGCGQAGGGAPRADVELAKTIRTGSGGAATQAAASTTTGWATLQGVFRYEGAAPGEVFLSTGGKDKEACSDKAPDRSLLVDPSTKGLASVVVFARKVSRVHESAEALKAEQGFFDQKQCYFLTQVLAVQVGQTILIKNSDPVAHNTNISPPIGASGNFNIPGGGSAQFTFNRDLKSPFAVNCSVHPWMKAWMFPRKDPYVAVSAADGTFSIKNLPAGEPLEFEVWHEKAKGNKVVADRADLKWNSAGRFKVTLAADEVKDLGTISLPAALFQ
jgi:plastocyanin